MGLAVPIFWAVFGLRKSATGRRRYFLVDEVFSFVYSQIVHIGMISERFMFKYQILCVVFSVYKYLGVIFYSLVKKT